jgi:hypothetical protein
MLGGPPQSVVVLVLGVHPLRRKSAHDGVIGRARLDQEFVLRAVSTAWHMQLKHEELSQHLTAAAEIGKHLGLTMDQLVERLRETAEPSAGEGQGTEDVA